jgi:hypothetical protein
MISEDNMKIWTKRAFSLEGGSILDRPSYYIFDGIITHFNIINDNEEDMKNSPDSEPHDIFYDLKDDENDPDHWKTTISIGPLRFYFDTKEKKVIIFYGTRGIDAYINYDSTTNTNFLYTIGQDWLNNDIAKACKRIDSMRNG